MITRANSILSEGLEKESKSEAGCVGRSPVLKRSDLWHGPRL